MTSMIPLEPIEDATSIQDIQDVFSYLGIEIRKFQYTIPQDHSIRWGVISYLDGEEEVPRYSGTSCASGEQLTTLTVISQRDRDTLKFFIKQRRGGSAGGISLPSVRFQGGGTWSHLAGQTLQLGLRTPLFVFAQDPGGVTGIDPNDSLQEIIARYQRVIVAFAQLDDAEKKWDLGTD